MYTFPRILLPEQKERERHGNKEKTREGNFDGLSSFPPSAPAKKKRRVVFFPRAVPIRYICNPGVSGTEKKEARESSKTSDKKGELERRRDENLGVRKKRRKRRDHVILYYYCFKLGMYLLNIKVRLKRFNYTHTYSDLNITRAEIRLSLSTPLQS